MPSRQYYNRYSNFLIDGEQTVVPYITLPAKTTDKKFIYKEKLESRYLISKITNLFQSLMSQTIKKINRIFQLINLKMLKETLRIIYLNNNC